MARRPLVATLVTTALGAALGALLGAGVGRVIAFLGDKTIEPSVPMAFCATLGFFIGAPAAAKGSLDRFGAARARLGGAFAAVIVIVLVGGAHLSHVGGVALLAASVAATLLAAIAATVAGKPQERPVAVAPARVSSTPADTIGGQIAAPFLVDEPESQTKPPAASAARRVPTAVADDSADEEPRRRRGEPLRVVRDEPEPEPVAEESDRPRRERPLRRGDTDS